MASIYKPTYLDRDGRRKKCRKWYVGYTDHTGRRRKRPGFRDKKATEELARRIERDEERRAMNLPVSAPVMLRAALKEYAEEKLRQGREVKGITSALTQVRKMAVRAGWHRLTDVTHESANAQTRRLEAQGKAPSTVKQWRDNLNRFLNWSVEMGYLEENPARRVKAPKGPNRRQRRSLSEDELRRLVDSTAGETGKAGLRENRRLAYLVAALSGLRRGEMRFLKWSHIDLENGLWRLPAELTKEGRGAVLPMLPECREALQQAPRIGEFVFLNIPPTRSLYRDLRAAGIEREAEGRRIDFHSLRYTFCTMLARRLPIQLVQRLMRHKDIQTTCRVYLDLGLCDVADAVMSLPRIITPQPTPQEEGATAGKPAVNGGSDRA